MLMAILGAHVSISGGIEKAPSRGRDIGCDAIQIFTKNQKQWAAPPITNESTANFNQALSENKIRQVVVHDSYLINLANPDADALEKSRKAFLVEMERAEKIGVKYLVFHPGSHMKTSEKEGIQRIIESLNDVISQQPSSPVMLLLETTAGHGSHIGYRFEHLTEIIHGVKIQNRIGVCYDTAHAFAAGYDLRTQKTYSETLSEFDDIVGLDRLKAFHLNDSKSDLGSRIDRHENIGKGFLGEDPFKFLVNDLRFQDIPMILETPEGDKYYKETLTLLRSYIK